MFYVTCRCGSKDVHHYFYKEKTKTLNQRCGSCNINMTQLAAAKARKTRSKRLKNAPRSKKGLKLGFALVLWAGLVLGSIPFMSSTVKYARADVNEVPQFVSLTKEDVNKPETILEKINRIALAHNLKPEHLAQVIACESQFNPRVQSNNYINGVREKSFGLAQIHITVHPVTREQAQNPDFAINFLADHWKQRHQMWVTCSKGL